MKQNGEPLSLRNGSWPLACFAGHLSVDFKEGSPVTVPLFDQNPLIFKLKKDWGGDGRRVPRVTKGHFIVIAPVEWGVPSDHTPVDPEGCSDPTFMAHYFFRDGKESESDLGGFPGHDVPSSAPEFTLSGRTVFDDSAEGDLFVGKPPQLIAADRVLWARVGEEGENGRLVPALSYLSQFEALIEKSHDETLSTAEVVLLQKLDLAELHQFALARDLSINLLKQWLTSYKFKDWVVTETERTPVTPEMKEERATWIAHRLNDHERWLTHGRGIDMRTLREELQLRIEDFGANPELKKAIWDYFWFLRDHMARNGLASFVHTPDFF